MKNANIDINNLLGQAVADKVIAGIDIAALADELRPAITKRLKEDLVDMVADNLNDRVIDEINDAVYSESTRKALRKKAEQIISEVFA